jgi:hypothetical protein
MTWRPAHSIWQGLEAEDPSGEKDDSYVYWIDENDLVLAPPIELSPEVREKMLASITRTLAADVGLCKTTATTSCRPYGQFSPLTQPCRRGGSKPQPRKDFPMVQEDFMGNARLSLLKQATFRRPSAERFPCNALAAYTLEALAFDISVGPENWRALQRYSSPGGSWARLFASAEFLETCRGVGFRTAPRSFDRFVLLANATSEAMQ